MADEGKFPKADGDILYASDLNSIGDAGVWADILRVFSGISNIPTSTLTLPILLSYEYVANNTGSTIVASQSTDDTTNSYYWDTDYYESSGGLYDDCADDSIDTDKWTTATTGAGSIGEGGGHIGLTGTSGGTATLTSKTAYTRYCYCLQEDNDSGTTKVQISDGSNTVDIYSWGPDTLHTEVHHIRISGDSAYLSRNGAAEGSAINISSVTGNRFIRFYVAVNNSDLIDLEWIRCSDGISTVESTAVGSYTLSANASYFLLRPVYANTVTASVSFDGSNWQTVSAEEFGKRVAVTNTGTEFRVKWHLTASGATLGIIYGYGIAIWC